MKHLLWFAVAALAVAAGCYKGPTYNPFPNPGPTCSPPAGTQTVMVYPAPNATAIPDQFGQVIVGSSPAPLPANWNIVVTAAIYGGGVPGGTFTAASPPFPNPNATPAFANPSYQKSSFGSLNFPGQVVTAYLNNTTSNCTPAGPIGSFTTQ